EGGSFIFVHYHHLWLYFCQKAGVLFCTSEKISQKQIAFSDSEEFRLLKIFSQLCSFKKEGKDLLICLSFFVHFSCSAQTHSHSVSVSGSRDLHLIPRPILSCLDFAERKGAGGKGQGVSELISCTYGISYAELADIARRIIRLDLKISK